jgi:hypothetical protein
MRRELQLIQLIETYLLEQLEEEDKQDVERKLDSNPDLKNEVDNQRLLMLGIERMGLKEDILQAEKNYFKGNKGSYFAGGTIILILILAIFLIPRFQDRIPEEHESAIILSDTLEAFSKDTVVVSKLDELADSTEEIVRFLGNQQAEETRNSSIVYPKVKTQYFQIDQTKDNLIEGIDGSIIKIKANSFNSESEKIIIGMKEYYSLSDIAFSNLSTQTTKGELLETGGMLYLEAKNLSGKKVELKKQIELKIPYEEHKTDMLLFSGKEDSNKNVLWDLLPTEIIKEEGIKPQVISRDEGGEVFTIVENMPSFPGCDQTSRSARESCTREKMAISIKRNMRLSESIKGTNPSGACLISFLIDERGWVNNVKVVKGLNQTLNEIAKNAVEALPRMTPGSQRGRPVKVQYTIPVVFRFDGDEVFYNDREIRDFQDSLLNERNKLQFNNIEVNLDSLIADTAYSSNNVKNDVDYYFFSTSNLGWINCDRFIRGSGRMDYTIANLPENTTVKMIFHRYKSILPGYQYRGKYTFKRVPKNEMVSIFVIKEEDGQPYVCFQSEKIADKSPELEFELLTQTNLKKYKDRIDRLGGN